MNLGCAFCKYKKTTIHDILLCGVYLCKRHGTLVNYNDKGCDDFDKE